MSGCPALILLQEALALRFNDEFHLTCSSELAALVPGLDCHRFRLLHYGFRGSHRTPFDSFRIPVDSGVPSFFHQSVALDGLAAAYSFRLWILCLSPQLVSLESDRLSSSVLSVDLEAVFGSTMRRAITRFLVVESCRGPV